MSRTWREALMRTRIIGIWKILSGERGPVRLPRETEDGTDLCSWELADGDAARLHRDPLAVPGDEGDEAALRAVERGQVMRRCDYVGSRSHGVGVAAVVDDRDLESIVAAGRRR